MRIAFVGPAHPFRGGIAHYIAILCRKLAEKGHTPRIFSFTKQYPKFLFPGRTQADTSEEIIAVDAIPTFAPLNPLSWTRTFWRLKAFEPSLLIFKYWMPFFAPSFAALSWLVKSLTSTKILYICDNIVPHEKFPGGILLTRLALSCVDFFVVQSETVKKDLLRFRPDANFKEIPHPIYDLFSAPSQDKKSLRRALHIKEERVLLFFGYVRAYKGLDFLLNTMPMVLKEIDVRLLVVGEFYDPREPYDRLIGRLGIGHKVTIVDEYVPNERVGTYFGVADAVVLPYSSATQSGIVQIAYGFNKPVITTDVGGLPEVVIDGKSGLVVPSGNREALAEAVVHFYDAHLESQLVEGVCQEKPKYSWDRMVEAIEEFGEG
ncbi:MAG: glycosyltransferase [Candidatus Latescibacterota bacterium]